MEASGEGTLEDVDDDDDDDSDVHADGADFRGRYSISLFGRSLSCVAQLSLRKCGRQYFKVVLCLDMVCVVASAVCGGNVAVLIESCERPRVDDNDDDDDGNDSYDDDDADDDDYD